MGSDRFKHFPIITKEVIDSVRVDIFRNETIFKDSMYDTMSYLQEKNPYLYLLLTSYMNSSREPLKILSFGYNLINLINEQLAEDADRILGDKINN